MALGIDEAGTFSPSLHQMRYYGLSQLSEQMMKSNAILGLLYYGADLVVYELSFEHERQQTVLVDR